MPSKTKQPRPPSRSRFQEGSMNDRASAAPPVQFLTNDENTPPGSFYEDLKPEHQQQHHIPRKPVPVATATVRAIRDNEQEDHAPKQQRDKEKTAAKKSSRIFGQVWDGVFGILSGKSVSSESGGRKKTPSMMSMASTATANSTATSTKCHRDTREPKIDDLRAKLQLNDANSSRPSKEDVLQSYHELVASGFFSSHAIQSTRHSRPGTAKSSIAPAANEQQSTAPPQWPLSTPSRQRQGNQHPLLQQHQPHTLSPIPMTPGSAGSRGTKRAAAADDDEEGENDAQDSEATYLRSGSKKLRKSASRDVSGAGPRLRSVSSRRILSRRSFSGAPSKTTTSPSKPSPQALVTVRGPLAPQSSPGKLTKRCPPPSTTGRPSIRAPLPIPGRSSSSNHQDQRSRNVSENLAVVSDLDTRVLRPRRSALTGSEVKSVVPDAGRGIPGVPAIPPKFTYGEDREVGGPWRGLRR